MYAFTVRGTCPFTFVFWWSVRLPALYTLRGNPWRLVMWLTVWVCSVTAHTVAHLHVFLAAVTVNNRWHGDAVLWLLIGWNTCNTAVAQALVVMATIIVITPCHFSFAVCGDPVHVGWRWEVTIRWVIDLCWWRLLPVLNPPRYGSPTHVTLSQLVRTWHTDTPVKRKFKSSGKSFQITSFLPRSKSQRALSFWELHRVFEKCTESLSIERPAFEQTNFHYEYCKHNMAFFGGSILSGFEQT